MHILCLKAFHARQPIQALETRTSRTTRHSYITIMVIRIPGTSFPGFRYEIL